MKNPYSLVFGIEPDEYVSRLSQTEEITESLINGNQRIYMITGVRGSGKTVFMTEIKKQFTAKPDWEVVELSTERDMLCSLAGKLGNLDRMSSLFKKAKINLSIPGIDLQLGGESSSADMEIVLQKMLETMKKHGKRLLVLVDEVIDNQTVREFASVFQIFIRDELPINLLMTGLYENIDDLQNEKNLTFLHRAPKVRLNPLNIGTMAVSYEKNLKLGKETALSIAQMTKGYSYAFQVFGFCMWEKKCDEDDAMVLAKQYLEEYVYEKIWSELSEKDKEVVYAILQTPNEKVKEIREFLHMEPNQFAPYKKRLIRKGVITDENGYAHLTLPFFDRFVKENYYD